MTKVVAQKKRYLKSKFYVTEKQARRAQAVGSNMQESPFEMVDVVELENPDGETIRVTVDEVENYKEVWQEMALAAEDAEAEEEEDSE